MELTKTEVATRQLDAAIKIFFDAGDMVSTHTLAAASATVFADILKNRGVRSWRDRMIEGEPELSEKEVINILRSAQNFFKHADNDPDGLIDFIDTENDAVIFVAILECCFLNELNNKERGEDKKLSLPMSVFQLWYIATTIDVEGMKEDYTQHINRFFPEIRKRPRFEQIAIGASTLKNSENGEFPVFSYIPKP